MSSIKTTNDESQNKGGRYPELSAKFFTLSGHRSDDLEILKMQFGSEGIDFYVSVFETLCVSPYFIYEFQNKHKLELLARKKDIDKERFLDILKFSVEELGLFNKPLYEKGFIFSEAFLNSFDGAGLFRNRTMTADDVRNKVKELLGEANIHLTAFNSESSSVKAPILNNSIEEERKEEKTPSKEDIQVKNTNSNTKGTNSIVDDSIADPKNPPLKDKDSEDDGLPF